MGNLHRHVPAARRRAHRSREGGGRAARVAVTRHGRAGVAKAGRRRGCTDAVRAMSRQPLNASANARPTMAPMQIAPPPAAMPQLRK